MMMMVMRNDEGDNGDDYEGDNGGDDDEGDNGVDDDDDEEEDHSLHDYQ